MNVSRRKNFDYIQENSVTLFVSVHERQLIYKHTPPPPGKIP